MHRRTLLAGLGTAVTGTLAGCGGNSGDGGSGSEGTPTETATAEPETATPTETPPPETATPTETPTPEGAAEITHEVGEEFTVGGSGNAVTYRILELARADEVGSVANTTTADGVFLVVTMELTNPRNEVIDFPNQDFRLQDETGSWQRFDREAIQKVQSDDRIDVQSIGDDTITGENSKVGVVIFDVEPGPSYRLWITPTGESNTPEHFVPVGDVLSVDELGGY
jgi:Telomeric repeat-binding factor 2.